MSYVKLSSCDGMAKRQTYEVDEESLRELMAGDVPLPMFSRNQPAPAVRREDTAAEGEGKGAEPPAKPDARSARRKKQESDYKSLFLVNLPSSFRCQTYVNRDIYDAIRRFLPAIAPDVSITGYINNVLSHHLELYRDEINELFREKSQKPAL